VLGQDATASSRLAWITGEDGVVVTPSPAR